jgi:WD40 repeat protein
MRITFTRFSGGALALLAFSPDGSLIASGDALRDVRLYAAADATVLKSGLWQDHTSRVTGLAWNPNGSVRFLCSVSRIVYAC